MLTIRCLRAHYRTADIADELLIGMDLFVFLQSMLVEKSFWALPTRDRFGWCMTTYVYSPIGDIIEILSTSFAQVCCISKERK